MVTAAARITDIPSGGRTRSCFSIEQTGEEPMMWQHKMPKGTQLQRHAGSSRDLFTAPAERGRVSASLKYREEGRGRRWQT